MTATILFSPHFFQTNAAHSVIWTFHLTRIVVFSGIVVKNHINKLKSRHAEATSLYPHLPKSKFTTKSVKVKNISF